MVILNYIYLITQSENIQSKMNRNKRRKKTNLQLKQILTYFSQSLVKQGDKNIKTSKSEKYN